MESGRIHAAAAIMRDAVNPVRRRRAPSRAGWTGCASNGVPGISGVDTRALVRHIREAGAMRGGIFSAGTPQAEAMERVQAEPSMVGRDLAREVTVREPETHGDGDGPRIIALDTGIKRSIIRNFTSRGAVLELYPVHDPGARSCSPATPTASSSCPAPATRPRSDYIVETIRELLVDQAGVRHLPRPPAALARRRAGDLQAAVRPPRRQPPGQGPAHGPDRDHLAEPRLRRPRRGRRADRVRARRRRAHAREPLRRHRRGHPPARRARRLRPVPPGGRAGARTTRWGCSTSSSTLFEGARA